MQTRHLLQRRLIKRPPSPPAFLAITKEIAFAQVLDPNQPFTGIVKIDLRRAYPVIFQKTRDFDVVTVFFPLQVVLNED